VLQRPVHGLSLSLLVWIAETPSASPAIATTVSATRHVTTSATIKTPSTCASTATPSATSSHAGNVGSLWGDLDVATLENAVVQDQRLSNKAWLHELDVSVAVG
jgi:hypothetical protein